MRYIKSFQEATSYHNLNGDDEYEITRTVRDSGHDYQYCDGILYELSGNDTTVGIDEIEETEGNLFYPDQIERYIQYFESGGICQTFPVSSSPLGGCRNLEEMIEYLDDTENFDLAWDILYNNHRKLFEVDKFDLTSDPWSFGFNDAVDMNDIRSIEDLDLGYNKDIMEDDDRDGDYDEELYNGFVAILDYWKDAEEYTLMDFNHRFNALKQMGKSQVLVEVM
jgi:hypothetical protein